MLIVYQSDYYVVANKPTGWSSVPDLTDSPDLCTEMEKMLGFNLHPVHRIDKPAAGLVLFAKTSQSMAVASQWIAGGELRRTYLAVTPKGKMMPEGTMLHYLQHQQKDNKTKTSAQPLKGYKKAELRYRIIETIDRYMLLELTMITGRTHQIRAQLAAEGIPIKGDVKYGSRRSLPNRGILLFSNRLSSDEFDITVWPGDEDIWHRFGYIKRAAKQTSLE